MSKKILVILLFVMVSLAISCSEQKGGRSLYKVIILNKDDTTVVGYIEVYPNKNYNHLEAEKPIIMGSDIIQLVRKNYLADAVLREDNQVISGAGTNLIVKSGIEYYKINLMKKIIALQNSNPDKGSLFVNRGAELEDNEYQLLKSGILLQMGNIATFRLITADPKVTRLQLFLYSRQINTSPVYDIENGSLCHPLFTEEEQHEFYDKLNDLTYRKNAKNVPYLINTIEQCKSCWKILADSIKTSQTILPGEKEEPIKKLQNTIQTCNSTIAMLQTIQKNKTYNFNEEGISKLEFALNSSIFPGLKLPSKFTWQQWHDYLLNLHIVLKKMVWS